MSIDLERLKADTEDRGQRTEEAISASRRLRYQDGCLRTLGRIASIGAIGAGIFLGHYFAIKDHNEDMKKSTPCSEEVVVLPSTTLPTDPSGTHIETSLSVVVCD